MHWQVLTGADAPDGTEASGASEVEEEYGGNQRNTAGLCITSVLNPNTK